MATLSVVINTKNAATTLEKTLKSVTFADQIVVVDMHSSDDTVVVAKKYTNHIFQHDDVEYVEPARNFAIGKASGDWILIVDADEVVPSTLREKILALIDEDQPIDCFYLPRKNIIFEKWVKHTGWWPDYQLRLFRQGHVDWLDDIHSVPITRGEVAEVPAEEKFAIEHHNYQSIEQYLDRMNRYTGLQAAGELDLVKTKRAPNTTDVWRSFSQELLRRLFADRGYQDDQHGLALALLQSSAEMVVELKKWQRLGFESQQLNKTSFQRQVRAFQRDLNYWLADWQVESNRGLRQWWWRLRRRFRL